MRTASGTPATASHIGVARCRPTAGNRWPRQHRRVRRAHAVGRAHAPLDEAVDGVEAIAQARRHRPAVVLMDIRMPNIDGLTATTRVLALPEPPRVLVLTTFDRDDWVYDALRAGASGFLLKDVRGHQLTDAIRTVAAGEALLAPSVTRRLVEAFVSRAPERPPAPMPELTEREREVLRLLAGGLSNAEIAESLVIGHSTVKTHVNRLPTTLGLRDRAQAVVYAYESGFVRPGSG